MHPEVEELRPKLKEVLYDCAVEVRATKAALYLFDGTSLFELVTEYGFKGGVREKADVDDPIVDRCGRGRTAFYINGLATDPRFSELLYAASTDRLLVAPMYSRGKLIGLIDMRDKAARQPFEQDDLPKAQKIADRAAELLFSKNFFGHRFIAVADVTVQPPAPEGEMLIVLPPTGAPPPVAAPPRPAASAPSAAPESRPRTGLASLILDARAIADRIMRAQPAESIGEAELTAAAEVLRSILLIPGALVATLSAAGVQSVAARASLADDASRLLQSKLEAWLRKRGDAAHFAQTSISTPFGTAGPLIRAGDLQKVFTAPVVHGAYLTVAFADTPDRSSHELLGALHAHLQLVLSRGGGVSRQRVAEELLEPQLTKYPALRQHAQAVAQLSESFARHLGLSASEIEEARIVGLVHDAGMRLLDYDRLYRKHALAQEELGFLREHPAVGAAMVEPLLGNSIARAVLAHHERVDGRGYPFQLQGDAIPLAARVVQICDAWVAMTDPATYQEPEPPASALATIAQSAGGQFDAAMAMRFVEMMRK
jgi:HD-GYP domain-containing protein (c-di-GMP phosphodiesterase class II)